jgi:hypothetical protein
MEELFVGKSFATADQKKSKRLRGIRIAEVKDLKRDQNEVRLVSWWQRLRMLLLFRFGLRKFFFY